MKRLFLLLSVLLFIKVSAQEPSYDFKKFRENNLAKESFKKDPEKIQPLSKVMGRIVWSDPNGAFILPLDKSISMDSLNKIVGVMQKIRENQNMGPLVFTKPNGTRIYALPQDHMPCLVPDMSQFNMPVVDKGKK